MRAFLTAEGEDALEYGHSWLQSALTPGRCQRHGDSCGTSDLEFFVTAPPPRENLGPSRGFGFGPFGFGPLGSAVLADEDEYAPQVRPLWRYMHDVALISGPLEVKTSRSSNGLHFGRMVEFTLYAEKPWVYAATSVIDVPPTVPVVVQDIPYNLAPYPSAELAGAPVVIATNYSQNPSLETVDTGWAGSVSAVEGAAPAAHFAAGRISNELAAVGASSYRARLAGTGAAANGVARLSIRHTIPLAAVPAGFTPSVSIWTALVISGGAAGSELQALSAAVEWMSAAGAVISQTEIGSTAASFSGRVFAARRLAIPAGAASARILVRADVRWTSSADAATNTDVRLYADAAALTIP